MDPLTVAVLGIAGLVVLTRKARPQSPPAAPASSDPESGPRFVSAGNVPVYPQRPAPDTNSSPVTEAIAAVKTATAAAGAATAAAGAASQVAGALGLT